MAYANVRSFTIDHTKVGVTQTNFPVLFTCICDTLNGAINNSVTSIATTDGKQLQVGDYLLVDSEKMLVTAGSAGSYTVTRAQLGTSAASHADLASITNLFLASPANGGGVTSSSGFDIIFATDSLGVSPVAYERVVWTAALGMIEAHVLGAILSSLVDTVLYILWGDSGVTTDQSNPTAVWDSDFIDVNHFPDGSSLSIADSTGLNASPTNNGATAAAGQLDGAAAFNGSSQFIDYGNGVSNVTVATMEAWINPSSTALGIVVGNQDGTNGYVLFTEVGGSISQFVPVVQGANGGSISYAIPDARFSPQIAVGKWSLIAGSITAGTMNIYTDGVNISQQNTVGSGAIGASTVDLIVGRYGTSAFFFPGSIDEVRVSKIIRSDGWLALCYQTQGLPHAFYSLGVTSGPPPSGGVVPQIMHHRRMQTQ